jgi:hypothetical protein
MAESPDFPQPGAAWLYLWPKLAGIKMIMRRMEHTRTDCLLGHQTRCVCRLKNATS